MCSLSCVGSLAPVAPYLTGGGARDKCRHCSHLTEVELPGGRARGTEVAVSGPPPAVGRGRLPSAFKILQRLSSYVELVAFYEPLLKIFRSYTIFKKIQSQNQVSLCYVFA